MINTDEIRKIQLKCLEMYREFDSFCKEANLNYFFCGGALIGAIRHEGFIPWDDDIDVFMKRSDYNKLVSEWTNRRKNSHYTMLRTTENEFYDTMLTQMSDNETTFIKDDLSTKDINHGLKLEIIPLDAVPPTKARRIMQIIWALVFCLFNRQSPPENKGKTANIVGKVLLGIAKSNATRYKIWKYAEKRMTSTPISSNTKYLTELCVTYKYLKNQYPAYIFEKSIMKTFEGLEVPVPIGYDEYLKIAFGDYMSLPPDEERVAKHSAFVDLDNSYLVYRGLKYYTTL